jgi:AcrR family transcriptional regulator
MPRAGLDPDAVVSAAAELADAEGLEAVTLARLAQELGVRPPSLYAHVGGLGDLRQRIGARGARELAAVLGAAAAGRAGRDALVAVARAYREYARAHPGRYAALQRAPAGGQSADAQAGVDVVVAVLRGYGLVGDAAIHAVRTVRSALHGFALLEAGGGFGMPLSVEDSFERMVAVLHEGLEGVASQP